MTSVAISFSIHAELASLPPEEADRWLDIVEANGWTREELREARRMEKRREDEENGTLALPSPLHFFGLCEVSGGGVWISGAPAADYLRQFSGWQIEVTVKAVKEEE